MKKVSEISKIDNFQKYFIEELKEKLKIEKHYSEKNNLISFTKSGLMRLGFLTKNENISKYIDSLEDQYTPQNKGVENIYINLEQVLNSLAEDLLQSKKNTDLEQLDKFMNIFDRFLIIREALYIDRDKGRKGGFVDKMSDFASDTKNTAYKFASKTEDDAYKFASNMGKDAYNFASKGMDYGYRFASKGMQYGYEFASKGEEVGEMANRVLWMASEIGIMADRIGEMSDRIVHTEHLIVQTAMLIQNFGLLIDGTIKHMSESILYSLTLLLDKEFKPLQTTSQHLDIISDITKEIIKNNHEYDMAVLKKQSELRKVTISALDKIGKDF